MNLRTSVLPPVAAETAARPTLIELQVLRALAALAVVIHHVQHEALQLATFAGRPFAASQLLPWPAGVDVFFVISGFIMVHSSARFFGQPGAPATFLKRRLIRIVPIYWAATALFLALALVTPHVLNSPAPGAWQVLASFAFIPYARPDGLVQPVYSLGWTLNYEMFFYVLFAAALVLKRSPAVAAVSIVLGLAVALGLVFGPWPQPLGFWAQPIVLEFVLGMGLGLLHAAGLRLPSPARGLLAVAGLVVLHADLAQAGGFGAFGNVIGYGLPAAALVMAAAFGRRAAVVPSLERPLAALGDASYALYLVHPFAVRLLRQVLTALWPPAQLPLHVFVAVALIGAVAASLIVYRWFEQPVLGALRGRLRV